MSIDPTLFYIAIFFAFMLASALAYLIWKQRKQNKAAEQKTAPPASLASNFPGQDQVGHSATRQLQLQAYERLLLLTDRIALPNLIQRIHQGVNQATSQAGNQDINHGGPNQGGLSAREMQSLLTQSIRQEFEHNITQQIYVSAEAWDAVRNFKEQNILIVNQVGSFLPEAATGTDLSRQLLDLLVQNPTASLQNIVAEALSYEAKKVM
jgi:hypothetical protein